jgi:hypothetical protein
MAAAIGFAGGLGKADRRPQPLQPARRKRAAAACNRLTTNDAGIELSAPRDGVLQRRLSMAPEI